MVWERELPAGLRQAVDIRWASDQTVYLALLREGVAEAALDPVPRVVREMIGGGAAPGGFFFTSHLASSSSYLVAASAFRALTWRSLAQPQRQEETFDLIDDIDVSGNRLAVLGVRRSSEGAFAPEGGIGWLGSLDRRLADLRPILFDAKGAGAPTFNKCGGLRLGAVRFLPDGSLLAVPGIQPGIHLYDASAALLRTWDTTALGIDTDCAGLSQEQAQRLAQPGAQVAWLNQRRTVDEVLPLTQGPALLIRSVVHDRPQWELVILARDGTRSYALPVVAQNASAHVHGDVRGGKILLLLSAWEKDGVHTVPPRLLECELPRGASNSRPR